MELRLIQNGFVKLACPKKGWVCRASLCANGEKYVSGEVKHFQCFFQGSMGNYFPKSSQQVTNLEI